MTCAAHRYAIYWAPPAGSALAEFGAKWLGRDAESGSPITPLLSDADLPLLRDPSRYGLHATLKPPFALTDGATVEELERALTLFASNRAAVSLGRLALTNLKGFLALCTPSRVPALHDLADDCVRDFDRFRTPASAAELAKRRGSGLPPAQDAHLIAWGYPYVFDQFQFHVTLTERLPPEVRPRIETELTDRLAEILEAPFEIRDLALFEEPTAGAPFVIRRRFPLG